jgi:hypothetical protein
MIPARRVAHDVRHSADVGLRRIDIPDWFRAVQDALGVARYIVHLACISALAQAHTKDVPPGRQAVSTRQ